MVARGILAGGGESRRGWVTGGIGTGVDIKTVVVGFVGSVAGDSVVGLDSITVSVTSASGTLGCTLIPCASTVIAIKVGMYSVGYTVGSGCPVNELQLAVDIITKTGMKMRNDGVANIYFTRTLEDSEYKNTIICRYNVGSHLVGFAA